MYEMETISTKLLQVLVARNRPDATRQFARLLIEERANDRNPFRISAKTLLACSARAGDRKAGWLLCKYFLEGSCGFEKDMEKARYWKNRTDKRLRSDAQLLFDDLTDESEARFLYLKWRDWLTKNWPSWADERPARCSSEESSPR